MSKTRLILLNSLVTSSKRTFLIATTPINKETFKRVTADAEIISFIGHQATAELLSKIIGKPVQVNRAMYEPQSGDVAVVVKLKKRLEKPEDVINLTEDDLEFLGVYYVSPLW